MAVTRQIAIFVFLAVLSFAAFEVRAHMHLMMKYANVASPDGLFELKWAYNKTWNTLYFKMKCKAAGWCGVGFADSAGNDGANMKMYDIAVGGYADNQGYLYDYWSSGQSAPARDAMQNWTLITANDSNGYTMVDFMRPALTGDAADVQFKNETKVWIMYGLRDDREANAGTLSGLKHSKRQRISLEKTYNLIEMAMNPEAMNPEAMNPEGSAASRIGSYVVASAILALIAFALSF